ncbi:hypothetical protein PRIPAC_93097 [Pristionchus pacificus]|uniref:Transmembrane protein 209 n=1 Tax=Pristionchus pacificus TaxID=54126 RepID=A0A8R1Z328_PRIPA|nr:hypothetical protein PRIPAC_93097 [Pristionchus pacificus]
MPPSSSTPTTSLSPGRMAFIDSATTPLKQRLAREEAATVKERYIGHAIVSSLVLAAASADRFWFECALLTALTRDTLPDELTCLLNMTLMVLSLTWLALSGYHSVLSSNGAATERAAAGGGRGDQGSKKSTVLTSTPALSNTSLPMTPQRGGGARTGGGGGGQEDKGVISPIFPIPESTIFGTPQQTPTPGALRNRRADYRPLYGASSPARPDLSWIDDHEFGAAPAARGGASNRSALSLSSARSHSASFASGPSSPSATGAGMIADLASSAPFQARVAALPSTKMLTSIHTQEQVDALLAKSRADSTSAAAAGGAGGDKINQSTSFYQAMLQLDGLELHPYQMSKDAAESKNDPYDVVYESNGGVHLSPRSTGTSPTGSDDTARFRVELAAQRAAAVAAATAAAGGASPIDGRRRRLSHASSPSRGLPGAEGTASGGTAGAERGGGVARRRRGEGHSALTESELSRAEQRLRFWMVNTIVRPLNDGIKAMNKRFESDLAPLHLRIGTSTVEQITAALTAHPELVQTHLPYLLPYLRLHANQTYLVARIASLALGSCMADFSWASGGPTPAGEVGMAGAAADKAAAASPLSARLAPRPWTDALPTDTQLVLSLFGAYMDTRLTSCAIVQGHNVDQPFSSRFTLISPAKPTALHQAAGAFYVHLASLNPPSLEFVSIASDGQSTIKTRQLFRALVLFLQHAAYENDGFIDRLPLAGPVLNLAPVLSGY